MVLLRLAISNFKVRRVRTLLTVAAIALSVSLVVAVTSGYKSMQASALRFLDRYMGAADALIIPANNFQQVLVPEKLVGDLAADPAVRQAVGRLESDRMLDRAPGTERPPKSSDRLAAGAVPPDKINVDLIGVRRPADTTVNSLDLTDGQWFNTSSAKVAVIDEVAADKLGLNIGDSVELPGIHPMTLKVIGIVQKPKFFAERWASVYIPMETFQHFAGDDNPPQVSRISIYLREKTDFDAFKQRWTARLARTNPNLQLRMRRENAGQLERNLRGVQILSYFGGAISMLTAMFIIFSALSMGVTERQRTLAMLRAVGAVKSQVFRLVILEALVLAILGVILGIPMGMLWIELLHLRFTELFSAGLVFNIDGMIFGGGGSILTALIAGMLPAWWASRISPLDAMNAHDATPTHGPPLRWAALGLVLIALDPLVFFSPVETLLQRLGFQDPSASAQTFRFVWHFTLGLPGIMIGFFLLAPMFVWIVERIVAPLLAVSFALPLKLLRQQLTTGIWRAAGTAAALMVGLATLIAMQVQGHTMIGGWTLPDRFPDIFIWSPDIISWKDQKTLAKTPGIAPGELMPVVVTTPAGDSKEDLFLASMLSGQNVGFMFFAVDPEQALRMIQLDFRDDSGRPLPADQQAAAAARAAEAMKTPRRIIVTDEFRQSRHVKIGDTVSVMTTLNGRQNYTICGIVWSPGADVIISMYDMSHVLDQRTAGSVFGSIADAKRDFGVTGARLFAANLVGGIDKNKLLTNLQKTLNKQGLVAGDVRHIKYGIERAFYRLLDLISTVAIAAMAVASLGVANTIMASVRSRRWQFGVLRSIGLGRGDLLRLILAEATMLGLVGVALGIAAGLEISVDARQLSGAILGYSPAMQIPWAIVAGGCLTVVAIAIAASIWPALSVARAQPLDLLQAGRAST
ncbi:MAG TPA: FtsX-like permease family protein [Tepidisphaeraceae bacterium]|jgi:putative ABC transport system permease protein|nr:FtsX-like permease family protein [Tepidisphaeraceae bacterium]